MVKAKDAIRVARSLIGTPYSELDCINLIKKVIRTAPGGVKNYTTAGTNTLWDSIDSAPKYRDLTERHEGLAGIPAGALPFKRYGADGEDHVGIATGEGTVIHSSSVNGRGVVETPLTSAEGWDCWGVHRYIEVAESAAESEETPVMAYKMQVNLIDPTSTVNVRKGPSMKNDIIGRLGHGAIVTVQSEAEGWAFVTYGDSGSGFVSTQYLKLYEEPEVPKEKWTTMIDTDGNVIVLKGEWRVAED
jgi:hypothetical protein